ncbi:endogenous retrovirus group K member 19 Gag polyprotein isoform X1 [Cavia porcellus]|uniref:endogenous retrovirus group K member 19 Gag polyprotein isoform X1 n=1 Tax=Cavia porcellus TaxID=10141 RepID=UPI002FE23529
MGQVLSEHKVFVGGLIKALKTREIRVGTKELLQYFQFIHKVCPWFPLEGSIDTKRWNRVRDALKDYCRVFGPEKVPVTTFTYWNLISELLSQRHADPQVEETVTLGEAALRDSIKSTSKPSSEKSEASDFSDAENDGLLEVIVHGDLPPLPPVDMISRSQDGSPPLPVPPWPIGYSYKPLDPSLSDSQEVNWEQPAQQASRYHPNPVAAPATIRPSPDYDDALSICSQPSSTLVELEQRKADLLKQIQLEKECQNLSIQLQALRATQFYSVPEMEPASSTPCSALKMVPASGSQPKMAFPVTEAFTPPRDVEEGT